MRCLYIFIILVINSILTAATTATVTITYTISLFDVISISGNPSNLTINSAVAGSPPTTVVDSTTTYAVTSTNTGRKITAALSAPLPTGVTLSVSMAAPSGATSSGPTVLSTAASALVTGISNVAEGSLPISYSLSATVGALSASAATSSVVYTIGP